MSEGNDALHPGEVELVHYARGTLARGHAAAVLAHCLLCSECSVRLGRLLARDLLTARADDDPPANHRRPPRSSSGR